MSTVPTCVQNGLNSDYVQLDLDWEWVGLTVLVTLGGFNLVWEGEPVAVPSAVLAQTGSVDVGISGYMDGVRVVSARADDALVVVESAPYEGGDPYPEEPDLLGRLIAAMEQANDAADRANKAAEDAETATGSQNDYEKLKNLPSIGGSTVTGEAELERYGAVEMTADEIEAMCV